MAHHGGMRWLLVFVLVLSACTPSPAPSERPSPSAGAAPAPTAAPTQLPAVEPQLPTLAEFRDRAAVACETAGAAIADAPLKGDPLRPGARARDVRAAVEHYRAAAAAWTAAAGDLWDFGLPKQRVAQSLVTALDTVGQYSHQTADLFAAGDSGGAQAGLSAIDSATQDANRITRRLGIGRIDECGSKQVTLQGAQRVDVIASDFAFVTTTTAARRVRFVLRNRGQEPHHVYVVRLREAGTVDAAVRADRFRQRPGNYLDGDGAASPIAAPGERATVDVRLRPGVYGLLCFVASEDGTPHAYKGMATELLVP